MHSQNNSAREKMRDRREDIAQRSDERAKNNILFDMTLFVQCLFPHMLTLYSLLLVFVVVVVVCGAPGSVQLPVRLRSGDGVVGSDASKYSRFCRRN